MKNELSKKLTATTTTKATRVSVMFLIATASVVVGLSLLALISLAWSK